jgi:hypothetical protein
MQSSGTLGKALGLDHQPEPAEGTFTERCPRQARRSTVESGQLAAQTLCLRTSPTPGPSAWQRARPIAKPWVQQVIVCWLQGLSALDLVPITKRGCPSRRQAGSVVVGKGKGGSKLAPNEPRRHAKPLERPHFARLVDQAGAISIPSAEIESLGCVGVTRAPPAFLPALPNGPSEIELFLPFLCPSS